MARRYREDEADNHDRWIVSYADFITLMFAFFTVLFAISEQNTTKAKQFESSIRQYLIKFGAMGDSGQKVNQGVEFNTPIEQPIRPFPQGSQESQKVQKKIETFFASDIDGQTDAKVIRDISPDSYGVRLTLASDALFRRGTPDLRAEALPILDSIAAIIKETHRSVIIEGHSNDTPKEANFYPTTWELSSVQATKILRYFYKVHKMDASKLAAMAYGSQRPLPPYDRRIDLLIITDDLPF